MDDVRVIERGDGFRFALEALEPRGIGRHLGGEHLERNVTLEPGVTGSIDFAHSTAANESKELVVAEGSSEHAGILSGAALIGQQITRAYRWPA
jgi:hypothetical protein